MIKNFSKIFALILTLIFSANYYAQCTSCTVTNPVLSGNYTFASGSTVCFTSNATLGDVTFQNNSKICVASGVTVRIQNNVTTTSGNNITFDVSGTLQFDQVPTINANLTTNILSGGLLKAGTTGTNNFTFNGTTNTLNNQGTVQVGVLQFQNSSSTNVVDNYGTLTIASNINIQGVTTFRNWNLINIGSSYNNNATSKYINCGTINSSSGFNLGGGRVINTGNFNVGSGPIDLAGGTLENYGTLLSTGTINGTGASIFYNEGLAKITSFQPNGASIKGPLSNSKKGYFYVINQINHNGSKVGPNLDFKKYTSFSPETVSGTQGELQIFSNAPTYVNSSGTNTTAALANVTYACSVCTAPLVTNIGVCPNIDGTFPPQANDDAFTIVAGSSSATNVLVNDYLGDLTTQATLSNVIISQVSTSNPNITINTSTGLVQVANNTPSGTYTLIYRICETANSTNCDTATVTITVVANSDSDGDGVANNIDLDDDNDGILDTVENSACGGVPDPTIPTGNGVIIKNIFKEDFGTMSTATGTHSVNMATLGTGATTNYNYYDAVVGTTPTSSNDGGAAPNSLQDNRYTIFNQITYTSTWATSVWQYTLGDHTGGGTIGSGRMFVVNASNTPGEFYRRTITNIVQGAPINASLWIMNIDTNIAANNGRNLPNITVKFMQGTTELYSYNTGDIPREASGSSNAWKFFKNPAIFIPTSNANIDLVLVNNAPGGAGNDLAIDDIIVYQSFCDFDNDGTPNYLDVDSDGDGCADAIEGSENVTYSQIHAIDLPVSDTNYAYRGQIKVKYDGVTTGSPSQIISTSAAANGVPQLLNNAGNNLNASTNPSNLAGAVDNTDGTADVGQGIGASQDNTVNSCKCYKAPSTDGNTYPTQHGITAFSRAGADNQNWPMVRQSGWTALEASTKGFVINRMPVSTSGGNTGEPVDGSNNAVITSPIAGMMFYDTTNDCLKINVDGTRSGWKCFNKQTCPDEN